MKINVRAPINFYDKQRGICSLTYKPCWKYGADCESCNGKLSKRSTKPEYTPQLIDRNPLVKGLIEQQRKNGEPIILFDGELKDSMPVNNETAPYNPSKHESKEIRIDKLESELETEIETDTLTDTLINISLNLDSEIDSLRHRVEALENERNSLETRVRSLEISRNEGSCKTKKRSLLSKFFRGY